MGKNNNNDDCTGKWVYVGKSSKWNSCGSLRKHPIKCKRICKKVCKVVCKRDFDFQKKWGYKQKYAGHYSKYSESSKSSSSSNSCYEKKKNHDSCHEKKKNRNYY